MNQACGRDRAVPWSGRREAVAERKPEDAKRTVCARILHSSCVPEGPTLLTVNRGTGFTLKEVQEGDTVCVFNNAFVPYVLRRANDWEGEKCRFVGDAYAHEVTYSAADEMELNVRDITLV
jgi:hypothetical protein